MSGSGVDAVNLDADHRLTDGQRFEPRLWSCLTGELKNSQQPLLLWFKETFPNVGPVYEIFRKSVTQNCIEPSPGVDARTTGTAFDCMVQYLLGQRTVPLRAVIGATWSDNVLASTSVVKCISDNLTLMADDLIRDVRLDGVDTGGMFAQFCWLMALFAEVGNAVKLGGSPLAQYTGITDWSQLLDVIPNGAVADLTALRDVYTKVLMPYLGRVDGKAVVGQSLSCDINANADIIKGSTLIEVKAMVGRRTQGIPRYGMSARYLYQLIGYALLAQRKFDIDTVAIFNVRYAHLYEWSLADLLTELAGRPVNPSAAGEELQAFLQDPTCAQAPALARAAAERRRRDLKSQCELRRANRFEKVER